MRWSETQLIVRALKDGRTIGYVVIDSTIAGRARGGLRMAPDVDERELSLLARSMTLKYGFLGLPQGGAKAGIIGDPEGPPERKRELLRAFARSADALLRFRIYIPEADMGTSGPEIRWMLEDAGLKVNRREHRGRRSGDYTARTVFVAARRAARRLGIGLAGASAAIEGFGNVGRPLAEMMAAAGARVVAVSTTRGALYDPGGLRIDLLGELSRRHGSRSIEHYDRAERLNTSALLELPVDILCPCARHQSIHAGNVGRVQARIISPGANNPLTEEAEAALLRRGVLCLPDFVTNSGGVLGGTMEYAGFAPDFIFAFIDERYGDRIDRLLTACEQSGESPRTIAARLAIDRFARMQARAARPSLSQRLFGAAQQMYRRGWLPTVAVRKLAMPYFRSRLDRE